ncbi:MAG: mechanosensitive ion channel [Spirochaetes bacterium]|nr:mechanosensitive ion channel [Spirochaetota bacterium]
MYEIILNLKNFILNNSFLNIRIFSNSIQAYLLSMIIFIFLLILSLLIKILIVSKINKKIKLTKTSIDDFIFKKFTKDIFPLLYFGIFYLSIHNLVLSNSILKIINIAGKIFLSVVIIKILADTFEYWFNNYTQKNKNFNENISTFKVLKPVINILIWVLGIIFLISNLGFNISAIITGLGIGGIAIALALQSILGDLFSYFSIILDQPFKVGDFIIIDNLMGTVEHIGIKTTRIKDLQGEQIIITNTDLTSAKIKNYKRMDERRISFEIGVVYETDKKKLIKIPEIIKKIITSTKDARFDRSHFKSYGDFSLIFETVYFVLSPDYNQYMDIQQEINIKIFEEFEKQKISFAYPTQLVYMNKK